MKTSSFKIPRELDEELARIARRRGVTKSHLVREALERLTATKRRSVTGLAVGLVGSFDGPEDLSTNRQHMEGYGSR